MRQRGFTLVELLIVVVIVGVLAAIAYPSYVAHVQKSRRSEGKAALLAAAGQMERYFTERSTYATATLGAGGVYPDATENGYYSLSLAGLGASTFTLRATPAGVQTDDPCGTLTYTEQGQKGQTGAAPPSQCW